MTQGPRAHIGSEEKAMRVGAAAVDITPPAGHRLAGYAARQGTALGTHRPLEARVLALRQGADTVALVLLDVVAVGASLTARVRAAAAELGLPGSHVIVAATHTHSGFSLLDGPRTPSWLDGADDARAPARVAEAARGALAVALADMTPARLRVGTTAVEGVAGDRREPERRADGSVGLLVAEGLDGDPLAVLVNGHIHPTVLEADNLWHSPDFPGRVRDVLEAVSGASAAYATGAAGDVNPICCAHDPAEVARLGDVIGGAALQGVARLRGLGRPHRLIDLRRDREVDMPPVDGVCPSGPLAAAVRPIELSERPPLAERGPLRAPEPQERAVAACGSDPFEQQRLIEQRYLDEGIGPQGERRRTEVQVVRLGADVAMVALPGEFFAETRHTLARALGVRALLVIGYANDYLGYVPPAPEFARGGYEVGCAALQPESEAQIRDAVVAAWAELRARSAPDAASGS